MISLRSLSISTLTCAQRALAGRRTASVGALALLADVAQAHDGHGLWGSHWHATDALGFVLIALALAAALWLGRGGK